MVFLCEIRDTPRKNLDEFGDEIKRRVADKHTHTQIRRWLANQGVITLQGYSGYEPSSSRENSLRTYPGLCYQRSFPYNPTMMTRRLPIILLPRK
jgi:hypothetical protein